MASFTPTISVLVSFTLARYWVVGVVLVAWLGRVFVMLIGTSTHLSLASLDCCACVEREVMARKAFSEMLRKSFMSRNCKHHTYLFARRRTFLYVGSPQWLKVIRKLCRALLCTHFHQPRLVAVDKTPVPPAHWSGMSGCWANPTPNTETKQLLGEDQMFTITQLRRDIQSCGYTLHQLYFACVVCWITSGRGRLSKTQLKCGGSWARISPRCQKK